MRRVRFKDGRPDLHVLNSPTKQSDRADIEWHIKRTLDAHDDRIAGYAIVVWAPDGASTADIRSTGNTVPGIMVPDFVRNRLLAEKIEQWTIKDLRDAGKIY